MSYQNVALEQTHKEELVDDIGDNNRIRIPDDAHFFIFWIAVAKAVKDIATEHQTGSHDFVSVCPATQNQAVQGGKTFLNIAIKGLRHNRCVCVFVCVL